MRATIPVAIVVIIAACQEQAPPPPPAPAPANQAPVAQAPAPAAPAIVYASAEPQHGGITQRIGDWMVEIATGDEGKVDAYVQKYEGAVPSFEDVQLEMEVTSKVDADLQQDVLLYPRAGKLHGTVAGIPDGAYNVAVKVVNIADDKITEATFEDVMLKPLELDLKPLHGGEVEVVGKTKMEVLRQGKLVRVWLRDFDDKVLPPSQAELKQLVVALADGSKEELVVVAVDDHFEGEIKGDTGDETDFTMTRVWLIGEDFTNMRLSRVPMKLIEKEDELVMMRRYQLMVKEKLGVEPPAAEAEAEAAAEPAAEEEKGVKAGPAMGPAKMRPKPTKPAALKPALMTNKKAD